MVALMRLDTSQYCCIPPYITIPSDEKSRFLPRISTFTKENIHTWYQTISSSTQKDLSPSVIEVWDASKDPEKLVISSEGIVQDPDTAALNCYGNMQKVDIFCRKILERHPVERFMRASIHCQGDACNRAFWSSEDKNVYIGDVSPNIYHPLVNNFDVIAHEFGHSIMGLNTLLDFEKDGAAIRESCSDVIAITAKHYFSNTNANDPNADWLIGNGLIVNNPENGTAVRSFKQPGTAYKNHPVLGNDPQVASMKDYVPNGEMHINSGIPNHAFYLVASNIGGPTWDKPLKIWHDAFTITWLNESFQDFAENTLTAARGLNYSRNILSIISKAWYDVGINVWLMKK